MTLSPRIRDVLVIAPIPLLMLILSPFSAWLIFAVAGFIGLWEYRNIVLTTRERFYSRSTRIAFALYAITVVAAYFSIKVGILAALVSVLVVHLLETRKFREKLVVGQSVIPLIVVLGFAIRAVPTSDAYPYGGLSILGLALIITTFSDSAAYFVGRAFGKHKFAPVISPKKTWEGAIGGWVFGVLAGLIYTWTLLPGLAQSSIFTLALLFFVLSVAGQMGDLLESYFKRAHGVKDSGKSLASHGGVMDRFDSLALVLPLLAVFLFLGGYV